MDVLSKKVRKNLSIGLYKRTFLLYNRLVKLYDRKGMKIDEKSTETNPFKDLR